MIKLNSSCTLIYLVYGISLIFIDLATNPNLKKANRAEHGFKVTSDGRLIIKEEKDDDDDDDKAKGGT